jgi:hypothetical protein
VTDRTNAYFLQVVLRKARENPLANLVLAECRLISFEAKPPQPISDVHGLLPSREKVPSLRVDLSNTVNAARCRVHRPASPACRPSHKHCHRAVWSGAERTSAVRSIMRLAARTSACRIAVVGSTSTMIAFWTCIPSVFRGSQDRADYITIEHCIADGSLASCRARKFSVQFSVQGLLVEPRFAGYKYNCKHQLYNCKQRLDDPRNRNCPPR